MGIKFVIFESQGHTGQNIEFKKLSFLSHESLKMINNGV